MKRNLFFILAASLAVCCSPSENPKPENGPDKPALHIGDVLDGGIVFYVDPVDSTSGKVLELQYEAELTWSDMSDRVGALSQTDGVANSAAIRASSHYPENYPAIMRCDALGEGWYLPAIEELKTVYKVWNGSSSATANEMYRNSFDALLRAAGGAEINPEAESTQNGQSYWSSTESESTNANAYYLRVGSYAVSNTTKKSTARLTRCCKVVGELTEEPKLELNSRSGTLGADINSLCKVHYTSNKTVTAEIQTEGASEWLGVKVTSVSVLLTALSTNEGNKERSAVVLVTAGPPEYCTTLTIHVTQEPKIVQVSHLLEVHDGGIVFWQNPENEKKVKVVSLKRLSGKAWCLESAIAEAPVALSDSSGKDNTAALLALPAAASYYAVNYCKDMGEGWYLPAKEELKSVFCAYDGVKAWESATYSTPSGITDSEKQARAKFESILKDNSGDVFNSMAETANGDSYWSSTEAADDVKKAYYVRVGLLDCNPMAKKGTARYVRCVKEVQL